MIDLDKKEILNRKQEIEQEIEKLNNDYCFCRNYQFDDADYEETYYFIRRDQLVKFYDSWGCSNSEVISLDIEATKENIEKVNNAINLALENDEELELNTDIAIAKNICEKLDIDYAEENYIDERYDKDIILFRGVIYSPKEFLNSEADCLRDCTEDSDPYQGVYFSDYFYNLQAFLDEYVVINEIGLDDIDGFGWEGYGYEQSASDYVLLRKIEKGLI